MNVFNFQDPTHNTNFGTSRGNTVFCLSKKLVRNQNLKVLRILVLAEVSVPLEISAQFQRYS